MDNGEQKYRSVFITLRAFLVASLIMLIPLGIVAGLPHFFESGFEHRISWYTLLLVLLPFITGVFIYSQKFSWHAFVDILACALFVSTVYLIFLFRVFWGRAENFYLWGALSFWGIACFYFLFSALLGFTFVKICKRCSWQGITFAALVLLFLVILLWALVYGFFDILFVHIPLYS